MMKGGISASLYCLKQEIMELQKASRKQAKMKLALQGPSGSGKTFSSLLLAHGITNDWTKIAIIDTENHSADLYAHLGDYNVLGLTKPFSPERYIQAIDTCEKAGMEVVIIDSTSAEWQGSGGILDIHSNMPGNSFANWSRLTPRHNSFVQKMLQTPMHIIATIRCKQDYVLNDKGGKMVPEKVGLKGITRDGMDYEFTIVFDIDIKHNAVASKDRSGLFMDKPHFVISKETGKMIKEWCNNGVKIEDVIKQINSCTLVDGLRHIYKKYPEFRAEIEPMLRQRKEQLQESSINQTV